MVEELVYQIDGHAVLAKEANQEVRFHLRHHCSGRRHAHHSKIYQCGLCERMVDVFGG